jgi:transcriptional regulator with XRE-family HTH domain
LFQKALPNTGQHVIRVPDMDTSTTTLRGLLNHRFEESRARNRSFSLRAFAKTLSVSPASLSQILSGKRPLTLTTAKKICDRLALSPAEERGVLLSLIKIPGSSATAEHPDTLQLEADRFKVISDWYHFAILSLTEIPKSKPDPKWIARRLGIAPATAQEAMDRLKRLGILEVRANSWRQSTRPISVKSEVPSSAIRKYHRQILEKATQALTDVPLEKREFGSVTMAINPKRIPEAKKMIRDFQINLNQVLESGPKSRVYTIAVQLFPIDTDLEDSKDSL